MENLVIVKNNDVFTDNIESLKEVKRKYYNSGHVYIVLFENNYIKIGSSKNVYRRIKNIENSACVKALKIYVTEELKNYYDVENLLHRQLKFNRLMGEWFNVGLDVAVQALQKLDREYTTETTDQAMNKFGKFIDHFLDIKKYITFDFEKWVPTKDDLNCAAAEIKGLGELYLELGETAQAENCFEISKDILNGVDRQSEIQHYLIDVVQSTPFEMINNKTMKLIEHITGLAYLPESRMLLGGQ